MAKKKKDTDFVPMFKPLYKMSLKTGNKFELGLREYPENEYPLTIVFKERSLNFTEPKGYKYNNVDFSLKQ